MKAKVKKTGEIVNIQGFYVDEDLVEYTPNELDFGNEENEHWQDVRERAAIAAMQGLLCAPSYEADRSKLNMIAKDARSIADSLIEELKKK